MGDIVKKDQINYSPQLAERNTRKKNSLEDDWVILRYPVWCFFVTLVVIAVFYGFDQVDALNFPGQKFVFSLLGLTLFVFGAAMGFKYPEKKKTWLVAEVVWLATAFFTVGRLVDGARSEVIFGQPHPVVSGAKWNEEKERKLKDPYWNIFFLLTALGFKAGRVGTELQKIRVDEDAEEKKAQVARMGKINPSDWR
jgi:hypothetical protein